MANPGGAGAPEKEKEKPPQGTQGEMAGQQQQPLIKVTVTGQYTATEAGKPVEVFNLLITTRNKEGNKEKAKILINGNRPDLYKNTFTSDEADDRGTLAYADSEDTPPDRKAFRLKAGEQDLVINVENLTHGGSDRLTLKAPAKPDTHHSPKPGTLAHGFWLNRNKKGY